MDRSVWKGWRPVGFIRLVLLAALLILAIPHAAYGEKGDGTGPQGEGSGSGAPGSKPLSFVSAIVEEGGANLLDATDVQLAPRFKLLFDKNVVNSTVWGINRECFTLLQDGADVPLEVTKIDDTINFDERQAIFLQPVDKLQPGVTYSLKVAPQLKAKNGVSTLGGTTSGRGITIVFRTAGETVQITAPGASAAAESNPSPAAQDTASMASPAVGHSAPSAASTAGAAAETVAATKEPTAPTSGASAGTAGPGATSPAAAVQASPVAARAAESGSSQLSAGGSQPQPTAGESGASALAPAASAAQTTAVSDLGGGSDPHWRFMMIITGILLVGWTLAEVLYLRRRRVRRQPPATEIHSHGTPD